MVDVIEQRIDIGGLQAIAIGDPQAALQVVFLHGRMMTGADLAPFAHSLGVPAYFIFPDAPLVVEPRGRSWWQVDTEIRARAGADAPVDLYAMEPVGRARARATLAAVCTALGPGKTRVLVGFSQGGMLAMDHVLHGARPAALVLLSSSRIAWSDWKPRLPRLAGMPVLIAHGRADTELAFAAGEALRDAALAGNAEVTWIAFDGGHEIPLVAWRALRQCLQRLLAD